MGRLTKQEKERLKRIAEQLYLNDPTLTRKALAAQLEITEKTLRSWIDLGNWEDKRVTLLTTKSNQLSFLYNQLNNLNITISERINNYADTKEANTIIQLTAAIKNLETETSIGDIIQVGKDFIKYVADADFTKSKEITKLFDEFINHNLK